MILANKIIEERKKNGWSQEELAEKLNVSRQSVSKWESAQSVPDLNRILKMSEIFGVTTDYLLRDEIEGNQRNDNQKDFDSEIRDIRRVSLEEAVDFLKISKENSTWVSLGVFLCIASPIVLLILAGLAENKMFGISGNMVVVIGVPTLLIFVAIAVYIFINCANKIKDYEFLQKEEIETAYGVDGLVRDKKNNHAPIYKQTIATGVVMCILSSVPLLISVGITEKIYIINTMVAILLLIVAIAVNMMVRVGIVNESYEKLLQEGDYTVENKKIFPLTSNISSIYWGVALAIYLAWSLYTMNWQITWVLWPVAGVLYAVVINITKIFVKAED